MSPEYGAWASMIHRCANPKSTAYYLYGARGIKVCERWKKFENFIADMGPRPSDKRSIDRKDNDGDYEPANCRWATDREQCRNFRRNHNLTCRGETKPLVAWAEQVGMNKHTLRHRLIYGWTIEDAIFKPINNCGWRTHRKTPSLLSV
jgi:hypothetical protein